LGIDSDPSSGIIVVVGIIGAVQNPLSFL
jgi:hypothetical protein